MFDRVIVDSVLIVLEEVDEDQDVVGYEFDGSEMIIRVVGLSILQVSLRLNGEYEFV